MCVCDHWLGLEKRRFILSQNFPNTQVYIFTQKSYSAVSSGTQTRLGRTGCPLYHQYCPPWCFLTQVYFRPCMHKLYYASLMNIGKGTRHLLSILPCSWRYIDLFFHYPCSLPFGERLVHNKNQSKHHLFLKFYLILNILIYFVVSFIPYHLLPNTVTNNFVS